MKIVVYLAKDANDDPERYVVKDNSIDITVDTYDDIKTLCQNDIIEEHIRDYFRERGYFYSNVDIEKYLYKNQDTLQIECYDNEINIEDIVKFIKNNDLNKFNKVIVSLTDEQYSDMDKFIDQDLPENIVFKLPDNSLEISYDELIKTINSVDNIINQIKDLSPFEQIMYLYDYVRDKVYCDDNDDKYSARNLTSVLLGDKRVCLGYANIFNIALKKLNIKTLKEIIVEKDEKKGHARNIVYINDPKYKLDAIMFFDPTFDSKKENNDDSFLQNYTFFARPLSYFKNNEREKYNSIIIPFYDLTKEDQIAIINSMSEIDDIKKDDFLFSTSKLSKLCNKNINVIDYMDLSTCNINLNKVTEQYNSIYDLLEKQISPEDFTRCLVEVRKKQEKLNPERFHLDIDQIVTTVYNRFKPESKEIELLLSIFGQKYFTIEDAKKITKKVLGKNNHPSIQKKKTSW